jgi:hypothetical protein
VASGTRAHRSDAASSGRVVVNGYPVAQKNIVADGKMQNVSFDIKVERSSWVALRILGSSHSNPVFVLSWRQADSRQPPQRAVVLAGVENAGRKERFYAAG